MRRIVVALVVAAVVLTVAGCGGGGGAAEPTDTAAEQPPAQQPPAEPAEPTYMTDRSATEADKTPAPFPSFVTTETPAVFRDRLDAKRPMIVFFFDPAQGTTNDVRAEIDAVMKEYRGLIDLVTFNIGEKDAQGAPTESAKNAVVYASELGVNSTPYIVVVDRGGFITWRWKGFVERGYIEREVERATQ